MKLFNLPTWLTLSRIGITPFIILLLYLAKPDAVTVELGQGVPLLKKMLCLAAAILYIAASISDYIDGKVARKYGQVTSFGKFLDPLADKVLNCSVLIMLADMNRVYAWVVIIIIVRELMVTGLRAIAADEGYVMAADRFGKLKTVLQSMAIVPLVLHYEWFGVSLVFAGEILLYAALVLTVFSGGKYLYDFYLYWSAARDVAPEDASSPEPAARDEEENSGQDV